MNKYTSSLGKCKLLTSILRKRTERNEEWEDNLRHPERFQHQKVKRGGLKRCACCGRYFKPTLYHEDDQIYCKDEECKRQRDNYRARKSYEEKISTKEGKTEHYQRSKAKRTMTEEAMGIKYSEDKHARTRNGIRRMVAEVREYLNSVVYAILGIIKSFGLSTAELVMERMQDYIKAGEELILKPIGNG